MDGNIDLDDHHQQQQQQQGAAPDFGRVLTDIDIAKANLLTMLNQVRKIILYRCPFSSRIASRVFFLRAVCLYYFVRHVRSPRGAAIEVI